MEKLLTIVVPTYNMEKYLDKCLTSLIVEEPLMSQLEVLVVNDGSKDRSSEIAHGYEQLYPDTFRVIDKQNGNYGSCVNRGIEQASGKYFRLLDADDWVDSVALCELLYFLKEDSCDMIITNMAIVDGNKNKYLMIESHDVEYRKVYDFPAFDVSNALNGALGMHQTTYKTEVVRKSGLRHNEGVSYTDLEYVFIPLEFVSKVAFLDVFLYQYYIGRGGQTMEIISQLNHIDDLYVVKDALFPRYIDNLHIVHENVVKIQRKIVFNVLFPIYKLSLCNLGRKKSRDQEMKHVAKLLHANDPLLWNKIKKSMGMIPVVSIWEKWDIYTTAYRFIWNAYCYIKELKECIKDMINRDVKNSFVYIRLPYYLYDIIEKRSATMEEPHINCDNTNILVSPNGAWGVVGKGNIKSCCFSDYCQMKNNETYRLSLFLAEGLPVLIFKESSLASWVEENNIGLTYNSSVNLEQMVQNVSEVDYLSKSCSALSFGKRLLQGEKIKVEVQ